MLEVKQVSKVYGEGSAAVVALNHVSTTVQDGEFVAITGPSGSGKSTLLNAIGGLEDISSGEVILDGVRIDNLSESTLVEFRRRKIAYIFQQYHLIPSLTALENVLLPLIFSGQSHAGGKERVTAILQQVGLGHRLNHRPSQLSGGEQQRVAIARALINDCSLILADEPTGNIDQRAGAEIMGLFERLNDAGRTIIMVTHNSELALRAKRIVVLRDGEIAEDVGRRAGETLCARP